MKPRLKSTRAARDLIKTHEPFHGEAVRRGKRFVVGYGHTAAAKPGVTLSREDAELLLIYDVLQAESAVHSALGEDIPDHVRDALVSFAASVGVNAFKVSDVARLARAGRMEAAANALESWVRAEEDGRLITAPHLVSRRAAEKALMLGAAAGDPHQDPSTAPDAPDTPDTPETQADPAPEAGSEPSGVLIDVDIAFEDPEEVAEPAPEPEPGPEPAPALEGEDAAAAQPADASPDAQAHTPQPALEPEPEPDQDQDPVLQADPETPAVSDGDGLAEEAAPAQEASAAEPGDANRAAVKAAQDAAIRAVMSRMAGEIAQSVSVAGVRRPEQADEPPADEAAEVAEQAAEEPAPRPEPQRDLTDIQLGYSYMTPSVVGVIFDEPEPEPEPAAASIEAVETADAPVEDQSEDADEPDAAAPQDAAGEAAGPGRAVASPAPGPVYASVSVGPIEKPETAPPHPAEAPAAAPGMSGESEGPDHPEEADHEEAGEDEAELEPAIVAGPEAIYVADETPPGAVESRGNWVHSANLVVGTALTGLGAWQLASNLDAYLASGLDYNWFGPVAFAGGVLLLVSSGWVVVGRMVSKKDD